MTRVVILVAVVLLTTTATAEPCRWLPTEPCLWLWPHSRPMPRIEPVVIERIPDLPIPEITPTPAPESPTALPRQRAKSVERHPKIKQKSTKPPDNICSQIAWGLSIVSRERVIQEAVKRGHSRAVTEKTIKDCGY